jgi:hypothetical protein
MCNCRKANKTDKSLITIYDLVSLPTLLHAIEAYFSIKMAESRKNDCRNEGFNEDERRIHVDGTMKIDIREEVNMSAVQDGQISGQNR